MAYLVELGTTRVGSRTGQASQEPATRERATMVLGFHRGRNALALRACSREADLRVVRAAERSIARLRKTA